MPTTKNDGPTPQEVDEIFGTNSATDDGWQQVGGSGNAELFTFENWKVDSFIEGLYVEMRTNVGKNNSNMYIIENSADHENYALWATTLLDKRFEKITVGNEVRIVYKGEEKSEKSGRTYKNFEVYHRPPQFKKA